MTPARRLTSAHQTCFLLLQIEAVTDACIQYLLQPNRLSPQQLVELHKTCHLTSAEAQTQALLLLVKMPWMDAVYAALCEVFKELVQRPQLCKQLLLTEACGNLCGIQVGWPV